MRSRGHCALWVFGARDYLIAPGGAWSLQGFKWQQLWSHMVLEIKAGSDQNMQGMFTITLVLAS